MSKIGKLGYGIVAFEGTEHIKNVAYEIRDHVDEIVVCLQAVSYNGVEIDKYDIEEVDRCLKCGLVDKVVWYSYDEKDVENAKCSVSDMKDWTRFLECEKRNKILDVLEQDGCTHAIIADSDEFYAEKEFAHAKAYFDSQDDINVTYCQYVNYWKDYRHYLAWPFFTYVPFLADIKYRFRFGAGTAGHPVDKTRSFGLNEGEHYSVINWDSLKMHHLSWIRLDISKKVYSWPSIHYFKESDINYVLEKYKTWKPYENAYVTFQTPLSPVCVIKLDRQYIRPHFMLCEDPCQELL